MKLTYFVSKTPNFGDALNGLMWHSLIKQGFFNQDSNNLFLGIGSIIWDKYDLNANKLVVGSGYGGYTACPNVHDGSWTFSFVRGPRTAKALDLDPKLAITDAAILTHFMPRESQPKKFKYAFMPHFKSIRRGNWQQVCQQAGIQFIDPRDDVAEILTQIQQSEVLLTEAMHGAILADTLRTPWIALQPILAKHRNKWYDWSESMELALNTCSMPASNLIDFWTIKTGHQPGGTVCDILSSAFSFSNSQFVDKAAQTLLTIADGSWQLSSDPVFDSKAHQALDALAKIPDIELVI